MIYLSFAPEGWDRQARGGRTPGCNFPREEGAEPMAIRIKSRNNESVEQMLRRFKKLCEKEGLTKDIKKRQYYEKPSERRRRAQRKAELRQTKSTLPIGR